MLIFLIWSAAIEARQLPLVTPVIFARFVCYEAVCKYYKLTYTPNFMHRCRNLGGWNPDMTFCYVSGGKTDSIANKAA